MPALFRAYEAEGTRIPTYFIESTAPNNVDDNPLPPVLPRGLVCIDPDKAVENIARHLSVARDANLVVMVHGFNNPQDDVLQAYAAASHAIENDPEICKCPGLVCVGYRWPSEKMGQPLRGTAAALPSLPHWLLWCGVIVSAVYPILAFFLALRGWQFTLAGHVLIIFGWTLIGTVIALALLRAIVYFRDGYRAASYGAPDLIEIIRQIDRLIIQHDPGMPNEVEVKTRRNRQRVQLSFIGHSMGSFIVTSAIRVLSDLFAGDALRPRLNGGTLNEQNEWRLQSISANIGNAFTLSRFVLASPDIPAETLLSNRANFLASSLRRFREAYLFSNEGDEVLRQISTTANYFSFPTKSWKNGYRLGNVEILSTKYGVVDLAGKPLLGAVRIGHYTLQELYEKLRLARNETSAAPQSVQNLLPEVFSYFDCTDYVDVVNGSSQLQGFLTFALRKKQRDAKLRMSWWDHVRLLWAYIVRQQPDVHGGYFKGDLCSQIIYRLACLGFKDTIDAYNGLDCFSGACSSKQIRVLLSPRLPSERASRHIASAAR